VPIARYFVVVGSVLMVLLLIVDWFLPKPPAISSARSQINKTTIRIESTRKWPEKIVFDTSQPTFSPPAVGMASAQESVERLPDEITNQTTADSSRAESKTAERRLVAYHPPTRGKRKRARAFRSKNVARINNRRRAISKAATRQRVARQEPWTSWPFLEPHW
jgi:hypothetical protein